LYKSCWYWFTTRICERLLMADSICACLFGLNWGFTLQTLHESVIHERSLFSHLHHLHLAWVMKDRGRRSGLPWNKKIILISIYVCMYFSYTLVKYSFWFLLHLRFRKCFPKVNTSSTLTLRLVKTPNRVPSALFSVNTTCSDRILLLVVHDSMWNKHPVIVWVQWS